MLQDISGTRFLFFFERVVPLVISDNQKTTFSQVNSVQFALSWMHLASRSGSLGEVLLFCAILSLALAPRNKWLRPPAPSDILGAGSQRPIG